MKRIALTLLGLLAMSLPFAASAQLLADFGTLTFTVAPEFTTYTTVSQSLHSINVVGNDDDDLAGLLNTPFNMTGYTGLRLTGSVAVNPNKFLAVELYDADFNIALYNNANWVDLGANGYTDFTFLSAPPEFNFNTISAVVVKSVGGGFDPVNATFTGLYGITAVPEPSACGLAMAAGAAGLALLRRRRKGVTAK